MKRRIKNRTGFTLAETLVVVLILALIASVGTVGVGAVMANRAGMIHTADAEILGSTVLQAVANELRFGQDIRISDEGRCVTLDSSAYGLRARIRQENGKLKYGDGDAAQMLSEHAYSGFKITELSFAQDGGNIRISVTVSNDKSALWNGDVTVAPLNGQPIGS